MIADPTGSKDGARDVVMPGAVADLVTRIRAIQGLVQDLRELTDGGLRRSSGAAVAVPQLASTGCPTWARTCPGIRSNVSRPGWVPRTIMNGWRRGWATQPAPLRNASTIWKGTRHTARRMRAGRSQYADERDPRRG